MPASASQKLPILAHAADGDSGNGPASARSTPPEHDPADDQLWAPPPLPSDPALLAELRSTLEQGLQEARAGRGERWETVHARLFGRID